MELSKLNESMSKLLVENSELEKDVDKILKDNEVDAYVNSVEGKIIGIRVENGDWKHDHAYLNKIMFENGFNFVSEESTGEGDSDCYTSTHYFTKSFNESIDTTNWEDTEDGKEIIDYHFSHPYGMDSDSKKHELYYRYSMANDSKEDLIAEYKDLMFQAGGWNSKQIGKLNAVVDLLKNKHNVNLKEI